MQKLLVFAVLFFLSFQISAQTINTMLERSIAALLNDSQMKNASISFYVADAASGAMIYHKNGYTALAPASTLKSFTAIAALEILGKDYRYKTSIQHTGKVEDGILKGDLIFRGSGDPSLGSWRYEGYKQEHVKTTFLEAVAAAGIRAIDGNIIADNSAFELQPLPGGWPWDDIGNYYGAGPWGLNWNENQFDMHIRPGKKEGDEVSIIKTVPEIQNVTIINNFKTTKSEDTRLFFAPYSKVAFTEGSVPAGKTVVIASGSMPDPPRQFLYAVKSWLKEKNIYTTGEYLTAFDFLSGGKALPRNATEIGYFQSPSMDKMEYWFMRKSINLYGEAFAKTIALEEKGHGNTQDGVDVIKKFWKEKGIDLSEFKMIDGSGLSPQNAVTAHAEVQALLYAQNREYYKAFYESMPVYNDMKMKSGTIARCKAFAGYHTSATGKNYVFSIIINNYEGSSYGIVPKMYKLLDNLKKY